MSHYEELIEIRNKQQKFLKQINYTIERKGNLGLCFKTVLNNILSFDDIEICYFNEKENTRYTIATFDKIDYSYCLNVIDYRLQFDKINIDTFYELVKLGIDICNNNKSNNIIKEFEQTFSCN